MYKGANDSGYTEIILPEGFDGFTAKVVVKSTCNLLSAQSEG